MSIYKVLLIESDPKARQTMLSMLNVVDEVHVVGIASNVMQARMQLKMRKPDVLLLDVVQESDAVGLFLHQMLETAPVPVVLLSKSRLPNSDGERKAMRAGFASLLVKPVEGITAQNHYFCDKLIQHIKRTVQQFSATASRLPMLSSSVALARPSVTKPQAASVSNSVVRHQPLRDTLVAIGASTGGTEALRHVISKFPVEMNAVLIVQHIPKPFAASFIDGLDRSACMRVVSAEDGMAICKGHIYVGAGDEHFTLERNGVGYICRIGGKQRVSGHCPSVSELFDSVAKYAGSKAVGALMTGMGDDGATGLKKMREVGARTIAQDRDSSVVWGMPGVAVKIGAAEEQVSLSDLGERLRHLAE